MRASQRAEASSAYGTTNFFEHVRRVENDYRIQLRRIAAHVETIMRAFPDVDIENLPLLQRALQRYADSLDPWAEAVATRIVAQVAQRDASAWFKASRAIGRSLREEVMYAPLGATARQIVADQVHLIRSLPLEAAQRVQTLAMEAVTGGRRYDQVAQMIRETGRVTRSRADLIGRTEVAKAQSAITQARALYTGSTQFRWATAKDKDVRPAHRRLEGRVFSWDAPPVAEANGIRHLPGAYPNCRSCWAEPLFT